eukprot:GFKZ01002496.1.p1 GENE.GFKZ01002496.1~~GFKZ01002496.1.p1  ORF type:complete len:904 (-),score=127.93 GFKZ01002496.1:977-3688(-)
MSPPSSGPSADSATGNGHGGHDSGDVELAIFRRIRSFSSISTHIRSIPGNTYRRYIPDPLSMFSAEASANRSEGSSTSRSQSTPASGTLQSPHTSADEYHDEEDDSAGSDSRSADVPSTADSDGLQQYVTSGVAWRDAMVQACADLLGKSLEQLQEEFEDSNTSADTSRNSFATESRLFEPVPRDLADFAIMSTLKIQDAMVMQNAASWLFNMMDRTGAGYVLREEFVRYAPFIGPVADAAVAGIVFDELIKEQVRVAVEDDREVESEGKRENQEAKKERSSERVGIRSGLRNRRKKKLAQEGGDGPSDEERAADSSAGAAAEGSASDSLTRDLYPPAIALRYGTWRPFFSAVQDKYQCHDDEWSRVKEQLGIDQGEILVKSQAAVDHNDLIPTMGKLFLSQRYLIFFAAIGKNHYVARLGAVAEVSKASIPIMMRDCIRVHLESESKAAMDGVSALQREPPADGDGMKDSQRDKGRDNRQEPTLSEHVGNLMRKFNAGRKPLLFSLLEFRETKRRDNWVALTKELVAAHKMHVQLGFGSSGRAVPSVEAQESTDQARETNRESVTKENKQNRETDESKLLNYTRSPFRNEPSPPLLVVAAHANIVRYRALRRVTRKRVSNSLLLFSHVDQNSQIVGWYTDSVRAYHNDSGKSWIKRALAAIRENMDTNDRIYRAKDDEPFDVAVLGDAIGRFAELCSPLAGLVVFISHLFQWRNPPATILAVLVCSAIAIKGLVNYVPAFLMVLQAAWVVETKYNWLGLGMGRTESEDAERRQASVLSLVTQVHDTLAAAQNVLSRLNGELGKVQSLFLWGAEEWQSWVAVGALLMAAFVLAIVPSRLLFLGFVFFLFFKHFLPPNNPALQFWQSVPSRITKKTKNPRKSEGRRRRRGGTPRSSASRLSVSK